MVFRCECTQRPMSCSLLTCTRCSYSCCWCCCCCCPRESSAPMEKCDIGASKNGDRGLHSKPVLPLFAPPEGEVNKNMFDFLTNRSNQHIWSHSSSCSQACWNATNVAEIRLWNKCTSLPHESGKSNILSAAWAKQTRHVFTIRPSLDGTTHYESLAAGKWHQETRGNTTG